jgi:hypothetical protein
MTSREEAMVAIAFAERETPLMTEYRAGFVAHVENWIKTLPSTRATAHAIGRLLCDVGALYCMQGEMGREEFLRYMEEAYDCYRFFVENAKREDGSGCDRERAWELAARLRANKGKA